MAKTRIKKRIRSRGTVLAVRAAGALGTRLTSVMSVTSEEDMAELSNL